MSGWQTAETAHWIWPLLEPGAEVNARAQFRRTFELNGVPDSAVVRVTADQSYRLWCNGEWIHAGPARGFAAEWFYDVVDLAPFLRVGTNVLAAEVQQIGTGTNFYIASGRSGFFLQGHAGSELLNTNAAWKLRPDPRHVASRFRQSIQLGWQEIWDLRTDDGWMEPGFNDAAWSPGLTWWTNEGCEPWASLQPRDVPNLQAKWRMPTRLVATASATGTEGDTESEIVRAFLNGLETWTPCDRAPIFEETPGEAAAVFDFGIETRATCEIAWTQASGGEVVELVYAEALNDSAPALHPGEGCFMRLGQRAILAPGEGRFEFFQPMGFRYIGVRVRGGTPTVGLRARELLYPYGMRGALDVADGRLAAIYAMCRRTQELCSSDTYEDCPSREQAMWWGDALVQFANSQRLCADTRLFRRGISLVAKSQITDGLTYGHVPTSAHHAILPDFTLAWIESFHALWWFDESTDLLVRHESEVRRALDYFADQAAPTGLLPIDPRYWLFLDWADVFKDGFPALLNLQYLRTLRSLAEVARAAKRDALVDLVTTRAVALERQILDLLWAEGVPLAGLRANGERVRDDTPHPAAWWILAGLTSEHHARLSTDIIVPAVAGPCPTPPSPYGGNGGTDAARRTFSPFTCHAAFEALTRTGHGEAVLDAIALRWGEMIGRGLTTTEELWHAKPGLDSLCHAWAAHPIVHLSNLLLGVRQCAPGWRRIRFAPIFRGNEASGSVDTPRGPVTVSWWRDGQQVCGNLHLPEGMVANIDLPGCPPEVSEKFEFSV